MVDCLKEANFIGEVKDNINPGHYKIGGIETWDFLVAKLTKEELIGYCKANILKYISRESKKGGIEDLKKAQWYMQKLVEIISAKH